MTAQELIKQIKDAVGGDLSKEIRFTARISTGRGSIGDTNSEVEVSAANDFHPTLINVYGDEDSESGYYE